MLTIIKMNIYRHHANKHVFKIFLFGKSYVHFCSLHIAVLFLLPCILSNVFHKHLIISNAHLPLWIFPKNVRSHLSCLLWKHLHFCPGKHHKNIYMIKMSVVHAERRSNRILTTPCSYWTFALVVPYTVYYLLKSNNVKTNFASYHLSLMFVL